MKRSVSLLYSALVFSAATLSAVADTTVIDTPFGPVEVPNDSPVRPGLYGPTDEPLDIAAFVQLGEERQTEIEQALQQDSLAAGARINAYVVQTGAPTVLDLDDGGTSILLDVADGIPQYESTHNLNAGFSISANRVWAQDGGITLGDLGMSLSGEGVLLGMWDGGDVRANHPEFNVVGGTARVSDGDGFTFWSIDSTNHANHVAGTMTASGNLPQARGIAWAADLRAWRFDSALFKMQGAVVESAGIGPDGEALPPLRLSNNSYGLSNLGWGSTFVPEVGANLYAWNADPRAYPTGQAVLEDYRFGFYSSRSRALDDLVFSSPRYLPVYSAGNDRNTTGNGIRGYASLPAGLDALDPDADADAEAEAETGDSWLWFVLYDYDPVEGLRFVGDQRSFGFPFEFPLPPAYDGDEDGDFVLDEDGDGENDLFDTLGDWAVAKNNLTVASVEDLPNGWQIGTGFAHVSSFSSFGPTDDGRIKPDISANGQSVFSSTNQAYPQVSGQPADPDPDYHTLDGTSMAAPGVTGGVGLLLELWREQGVNGGDPLASTLKAIAINSVDEIGPNLGPDYRAGWGLFNVATAAEILRYNSFTRTGGSEGLDHGLSGRFVREIALLPGESWQTDVISRGLLWDDNLQRLRATAVWTDAPGTVLPRAVDDRTPMLVNDLDLRLVLPGIDGVLGTVDDTTVFPWRLDPDNPFAAATRGENTVDNVEQIDALNVPSGTPVRIVLSRKPGGTAGVQPVSLVISGAMPPARATSMVFLPNNRADVGWPSIIGKTYRIESSSTLDPAIWTPVTTVTATESFTIATIVTPDVDTQFWRVVEL